MASPQGRSGRKSTAPARPSFSRAAASTASTGRPFRLFCDHFLSKQRTQQRNVGELPARWRRRSRGRPKHRPTSGRAPADTQNYDRRRGSGASPHHRSKDRVDYRIPANGRGHRFVDNAKGPVMTPETDAHTGQPSLVGPQGDRHRRHHRDRSGHCRVAGAVRRQGLHLWPRPRTPQGCLGPGSPRSVRWDGTVADLSPPGSTDPVFRRRADSYLGHPDIVVVNAAVPATGACRRWMKTNSATPSPPTSPPMW